MNTELCDDRPVYTARQAFFRAHRKTLARITLVQGLDDLRIHASRTDILQSGGRGYRLTEKIKVINGTEPANEPDDPDPDPVDDPDLQLNKRQEWVIGQIQEGRRLQIDMVIKELKCSKSTAKREIAGLKAKGLIEFIGNGRAGHYKLKEPVQADFRTICPARMRYGGGGKRKAATNGSTILRGGSKFGQSPRLPRSDNRAGDHRAGEKRAGGRNRPIARGFSFLSTPARSGQQWPSLLQ